MNSSPFLWILGIVLHRFLEENPLYIGWMDGWAGKIKRGNTKYVPTDVSGCFMPLQDSYLAGPSEFPAKKREVSDRL